MEGGPMSFEVIKLSEDLLFISLSGYGLGGK